jgi:hypothetical protein
MAGIGYKVIPDPGQKNSNENKMYFDKYRNIFKFGGVLCLVYAVHQAIYIALGFFQ